MPERYKDITKVDSTLTVLSQDRHLASHMPHKDVTGYCELCVTKTLTSATGL